MNTTTDTPTATIIIIRDLDAASITTISNTLDATLADYYAEVTDARYVPSRKAFIANTTAGAFAASETARRMVSVFPSLAGRVDYLG